MAATQANRHRGMETRNQIAELVANGESVNGCAARLGLSGNAVWKHWRAIRDGLGWQAQ